MKKSGMKIAAPAVHNMFLILWITGWLLTVSLGSVSAKTPEPPDLKSIITQFPQQMEMDEFERHFSKKMSFKENPVFLERVKQKKLPPVKDRLPSEPLVVISNETTGKYGGTLNGISIGYESGSSEILSWRQVNFVRFSEDNRTIVPNVVKSWQWNQNRSEITFTLRKGHRWSDGKPFSADDVVFYINDIILNKDIHPQTPIPWAEYRPRVEKIDDVTVRFTFEKPYPALLYFLGGNGSYHDPYAPMHFLSKYHLKYNPEADKIAKGKGFENWTAQFKMYWNRWKDGVVKSAAGLEVPTLESHILMEAPTPERRIFVANPYYFKIDPAGSQLPYITYHQERFLEEKKWSAEIVEGRVDQKSQNIPLNLYPVLKENQKNGGYSIQMPTTGLGPVIFFNKTHKDPVKRQIYAEQKFNYAVSLAINRGEINEKLFLGLCKPQQALPQNTTYVTDQDKQFMTQYDPAKAGQLLDELGLKKGPDGFRMTPDGQPFTILWEYSLQFVGSRNLPEMIAGYWKDIGLRAELKEVTSKEAREKQFANTNDISNEIFSPFEPTVFASPITFMPPYGTAHPVSGVAWWEWKNTKGASGMEPPQWVKNLWEIGEEFTTLIPGSEWYQAIGKKIVKINLENLSIIGTLAEVPLITVVSDKLGNVPQWKANSYYYGYTYPYRVDQWYFK